MNEQLQTELLKIVTNINQGAETAWGFLTEQTPEVVRQLLLWHGLSSFLWFCFFLALAIAILVSIKKISQKAKIRTQKAKQAYKDGKEWTRYSGSGWVTSIEYDNIIFFSSHLCAGALFAVSFSCGVFALTNLTWLKIWLAPKVWLLEYITAMVK